MNLLSKSLVGIIVLLSSCKPDTNPDQLINQKASLPQTFKLSALHQKVITTFINNKKHITGVLYGNAKAYSAATAAKPVAMPGEWFTLVTWHQQDDEHWFGACIPGNLLSAETLKLTGGPDARDYEYQKFLGKKLVKLADTTGTAARVKYILSQKASITP
jgi:hypothetical protein